ncbi:MAG: methyltransferase domain-containing protein [Pseudomonadota bacterium]
MQDSKIFDRDLLRKRRNKIASNWHNYNFIKLEAAERLADCIIDIAREFHLVLDIGCHKKELANIIVKKSKIISCDFAENMQPDIVCDEELLPFADNSFDLVTSVLSLHHVNDLVGTLIQIKNILKPDAPFIGIIYGVNTLIELRNSFLGVSSEFNFPLSPRISSMAEIRDAGALLQRAGFALPVINTETITVNYDNLFKLMADLRGQGESNIMTSRSRNFTTRSYFEKVAEYYQANYGNQDGTIRATFELITVTGWKPHESQQKSAKRGSGKINLNQLFD